MCAVAQLRLQRAVESSSSCGTHDFGQRALWSSDLAQRQTNCRCVQGGDDRYTTLVTVFLRLLTHDWITLSSHDHFDRLWGG